VLLRVQDEKSLHRSGTLENAGFRGLEDPGQNRCIEGALMVFEHGAHIHGSRGFRGRARMVAYFIRFMFIATLTLFGFGGFFLYDAVAQPANSQGLEVIAGGVLVALGLLTLYPQGQLAIRWLREIRTHSNRIP
jgi:hypothetical protein